MHVEDWFHQAEHELEKFLKSSKENSKNHEGWLLLGKVYLQLARARFKDDEETEQDEVEAENVHRAKCAFKQALELKDSPSYTLAASSAFLDHALLQKSHRLGILFFIRFFHCHQHIENCIETHSQSTQQNIRNLFVPFSFHRVTHA